MSDLGDLYHVRVAKLAIKGVTFNIEERVGNTKYVFQVHDKIGGVQRPRIISRLSALGYERGDLRGRYYLVSQNRCFFKDISQVLKVMD